MASARPRRRTPVWQEVEQQQRRKVASRVKARRRSARRYAVVYDIEGPRVRLGMLWFAGNVVALIVGLPLVVPLYAVTAGVAALQTAKAWTARGRRPHRVVAGAGAAGLPVAAALGTGLMGLAVLALAGAAVATAFAQPDGAARSSRAGGQRIVHAACTVQCSLFAGLAAASVVITERYEIGAVWTLVLLVAAYETGDYIVGSGAANPYEGPIAGIAAILVITFTISALGVPPFEFPAAFVFGGFAAVLCPAGQLTGSVVLPSAAAPAPALRRIDSLLVLGPFWAFAVGLYIQSLQSS